ncbi:MAG: tetratricopeptide repeat protein [Thermoguttaceae bacterium]
MTPELSHFMRVAKRVSAAAGYLELGMSQHTLDCLENLGDVGPFEADVDILRGAAFRLQHRFQEADVALATAAEKSPAPEDKAAWIALSICYNEAGNPAKALQMLARAEGRRR